MSLQQQQQQQQQAENLGQQLLQHQQDLNANSSPAARVVASLAVAACNPNNNGSSGAQSGIHKVTTDSN